jgi:F-type H+-transporting ATPase subunit delta
MAEHTGKRIATAYAQALYEAASPEALPVVRADVESLRNLLREVPQYERYLADPQVEADAREQILRQAFDGRVDRMTLNFLLVLNRRWRLGSLPAILDAYAHLDNVRRLGRREVELVSPLPLEGGMLEQIKQGIAAWGGFEPLIRVRQDPSLLGGWIIRIGDQQIDATIRGQLERLRGQLKTEFQSRSGRQRAAG